MDRLKVIAYLRRSQVAVLQRNRQTRNKLQRNQLTKSQLIRNQQIRRVSVALYLGLLAGGHFLLVVGKKYRKKITFPARHSRCPRLSDSFFSSPFYPVLRRCRLTYDIGTTLVAKLSYLRISSSF